jgi:hypothetical protein
VLLVDVYITPVPTPDDEEGWPMEPYRVVVRRRGVSPLTLTLVVRAASAADAAGLAAAVAERDRGGMFEAGRVRPARPGAVAVDA